jgi:toluene monooxygenase system ferredoxin subunit
VTWQFVIDLDELEIGEVKEVSLDSKISVVALRTDDFVRVIPPLCPHMEEPLRHGFCEGNTVTCSKHFWEWNANDGSVLESADKPLHMYESKVENGKVFAFIEEEFSYEYD